jgi:shikimate dehydrogenase
MRTASESGRAGAERRLAVLGSPIAHSKSPALHAAAYQTLGLPWRYETVDVTSDRLSGFVDGLDAAWLGLSLTMPLKHAILPSLASRDRVTEIAGAANTVLIERTGGRAVLHGFNTDVAGIVRALHAAGHSDARDVRILGGGATAASAMVAAAELGAERVAVQVRSPQKAAPLIELGSRLGLTVTVAEFGAAGLPHPQLVVSTLPGGTEPTLGFTPDQRHAALLFDVAYDPWPSALASAWSEAGGPVLSGLAMLVHQALLQVRIFVGGDPDAPLEQEAAVLAAMLAAVGLEPDGTMPES